MSDVTVGVLCTSVDVHNATYRVESEIQSARVAHVLALLVASPRRRLGDAAVGAAEGLCVGAASAASSLRVRTPVQLHKFEGLHQTWRCT